MTKFQIPKEVRNVMAKMAMQGLKITEKQANKRLDAIINSNVLDQFNSPIDKVFQYTVDIAMQIPQETENENVMVIEIEKYNKLVSALRSLRNSVYIHPDCVEGSEFDDFCSKADKILSDL